MEMGTVDTIFPLPYACPQKSRPSKAPKYPIIRGTHTCPVPKGMVSLQRKGPWFQVLALYLQDGHGDPCLSPPYLAGPRSARTG